MSYRGRFAPSPTGPLHLGSLVTALASFLDARLASGEWLVRMEDVDGPRTVPGADKAILDALSRHGFAWDGEIVWQSQRKAAYQEALEQLKPHVYTCGCSRKEVGAGVYPGTCRNGLPPGKEPRSWRLRVPDIEVSFTDRRLGHITQHLAHEVGDVVLLRADGIFAYHLAVVVDDAWQGITNIVRGEDLLDSTPVQIYLQRLLEYPEPRYLHLPLVRDAHGEKLSKQTGAAPISDGDLRRALEFLGETRALGAIFTPKP